MRCPHCDGLLSETPLSGKMDLIDGRAPKFTAVLYECEPCRWSRLDFNPAVPFTPASIEMVKP